MKTERPFRPDPQRPGRIVHQYPEKYIVSIVPSSGKPGHVDIVLLRSSGFGGLNIKQSSEVVRAWRGRLQGPAVEEALREAHALRDELVGAPLR
jgi:hypothetical protein